MRQHWFHCTHRNWGNLWKVGMSGRPFITSNKEPNTPRLCVASSVAGCFAARLFAAFSAPVHIYRTETPRKANKPVNVWDAPITGEMWLVPPVHMVWIDTLSQIEVLECQYWLAECLRQTVSSGKPLSLNERLASYMEVVESLKHKGPPYVTSFDKKFTSGLAKTFGIGDWREVFMNRVDAYAT